jgi:anti-sigma B factor antagonist
VSPVSPKSFQVSLADRGDSVVISVQGEVDTATAPQMGQALDAQLARRRRIVLDLSAVEFMDLHGLAVLMRANRRTRVDGGSFALERPAPCVIRLLELVRLDGEFAIVEDGAGPPDAA